MITAGEDTAAPEDWAEVLVTGLLQATYKDALVYIDDRGWFDNTFDSTYDLEAEVQRVLDLRYEFGVVDDWPEFPFPERWKPYYLERRRLERRRTLTSELLKKIVANEKKYRTDAITYLQETAKGSRSAQQTVCLMWNKDGECRKSATGGSSKDVSKVRNKCGVSLKKETLCAEELFLTKYEPWPQWLVSASYDMTHGWKAACKKGCDTILDELEITDAARNLRWKANEKGKVKSWSVKPG